MKIQIDTNKKLHKKLKLEKVNRDRNTLAETIIELLEEYLK